jgi:hypothetical protein
MRFAFIAATVMIFLLIACNGPTEPTPGTDKEDTIVETPEPTEAPPSAVPPTPESPEDTVVETPEPTEAPPSAVPPTPESPENTLIETPEYTGVIVSEAGASEFRYLFEQASTTFWGPSGNDVSKTEECIRQFLVAAQDDPKLDAYQKESAAFILESLAEYRRQYVGILVDGEKRIWCNSFRHDNPRVDWTRIPVDVDGGGPNFWQIEYIVPKDECTGFHVHGQS